MNDDEKHAFLERKVAELAEVFDVVSVHVAWLTPENSTKYLHKGSGLWHARQGLCHEFINMDMASEQASQISSKLNPPDDP